MQVSRRDFLRYCSTAAAALGLSQWEMAALADQLESENGPVVLWLQGSGCTGCSMSFLNHISAASPTDVGDVLINVIDLQYHPNLMAAAGQTAVDAVNAAYQAGGYVLVVEGGVPTAFGGAACWAWTENGVDVTFEEAVLRLGERAAQIVCVGECASYGGIFAAPPNPTGIQRVSTVTGRSTINIAGCPTHPAWIVYVVARLVAGQPIPLDSYGRPQALFGSTVHAQCPYRNSNEAHTYGLPNRCLEELGCRGESTRGNCPSLLFNGGTNWCAMAGSPCIGCTNPGFPGTYALLRRPGSDD